jgi:hypothetical protein
MTLETTSRRVSELLLLAVWAEWTRGLMLHRRFDRRWGPVCCVMLKDRLSGYVSMIASEERWCSMVGPFYDWMAALQDGGARLNENDGFLG